MGKRETIERKQLKPIIADYIRECAARMGERNNLQLTIRHDDWGNRINGVWKWSSSEITVGDDKYTIKDRQVTDESFLAVIEDSLKESGVRGNVFTKPSWNGFCKTKKFSRLEIFSPPCQEFNRLNDLLKGLTRKTLADTDIYGVNVCGKRSSYSDSGSYRYLCYNKENCKNIADLIEAVYDDKDTLLFTVKEFLDHGDEDYYRNAMYNESEWYGSRGQNLHIIVKGSDGMVKFKDICTFSECPPVPCELVKKERHDDISKITVKGSHGKVLNLIPSDDPVKNRIIESLKDRLIFHDVKSVDDILDRTKDSYEMKVWNRLNKDLWEIAYRKNNTDIRLNISPSDDLNKIKVVEHVRRYYGQSDINEIVGDFDLKDYLDDPKSVTTLTATVKEILDGSKIKIRQDIPESDIRPAEYAAKQAVYFRIVTPSSRRFTPEQIDSLNQYRSMFSADTDTKELFARLYDFVIKDADVECKPEKWKADTAKELNDLADGITREQGQGLKR